jgi:succinate-semialdehyde dehydrogenase/glutarate-semialdehyde dehydrogenase
VSEASEQAVLDAVPDGLLVGGDWRPAASGRTLEVHDPATGAVLKTIADGGVDDGVAALDAAVEAGPAWARTSPRERGEILRRTFDLLQERRDEVALLMTLEMGKPLAESQAEVTYGGEFLRWFSEEAVRITGRSGTNPEGSGRMLVSQHPVGPCYLITPWNFPLAMATRKVAPALAAGCTVVVKPAELTPLTTLFVADLLRQAGLPDGVVNVLTTSTAGDVSGPVISDPRLRKLSFTGSTAVGKQLLHQAADGVLRTSMELGGNAPFLVFEDADLDEAVAGALLAKFRNVGQACTAANRFLVHERVADEFTARVTAEVSGFRVGRGTEEGVRIGPLIDDRAVRKADSSSAMRSDGAPRCSPGAARSSGRARSTPPPSSPASGRAATSCARRSSHPSWPSRPSATRTRRSPWPTPPSTAWSATPTPATPTAASGSSTGSRPG